MSLCITPSPAGQLHCSCPDYYLRHIILIALQCILNFIPHHCPCPSSYLSPRDLADGVYVPIYIRKTLFLLFVLFRTFFHFFAKK